MHNDALDRLTDYPFDRLRALLGGLDGPAGIEPVIMSLGEPQHPSPTILAETVAAHASDWNRYPPVAGTPELLAAITDWLGRRYGLPEGLVAPARHVVAVSGTREALYMAGDICIPGPGDGGAPPLVLIPNPFYQVYVGATLMRRAEPLYMPATKATGFLPDFEGLSADDLRRTALAFLCSPANPQGTIANLDYLKTAITMAREYDFVLAADECYAEIYDRDAPPGLLQAAAELGGGLDNILVFHSLSKRSSAPGLRSGFVAGDANLIQGFKTLRNYGGATLPIPILAAAAALWRDDAHAEDNRTLYRQKFDLADQILQGQLGYYRPGGGFYLWLDVGDGEDAARRLWCEAGVRVIPGGYLASTGADGVNPGASYIRIALVQTPDEIGDALTRIRDCLT
jgi:N-succinyldiaminopimelate aminotransferase